MGFLGGPTDRVGDSFNFLCVLTLSKLCAVSDAHLRVREKHANDQNVGTIREHFVTKL